MIGYGRIHQKPQSRNGAITKMISQRLLKYYDSLEVNYHIVENPDYEHLVVPNNNSKQPIHRWFHLKEGFSYDLLENVIRDTDLFKCDSLSLLDPFVGGGTSVVSGLMMRTTSKDWPIYACGIERNPFLKFVADTKVRALMMGPKKFKKTVQQIVKAYKAYNSEKRILEKIPDLSTFHNRGYFNEETIHKLLALKTAIKTCNGPELEKSLAYLCLAGSIEAVSSLRKDGRALRYVPDKNYTDVLDEFMKRADVIEADILELSYHESIGQIFLGDGRIPELSIPSGRQFNLVLFSPPYPNNIDYTEVYKLESWFLGFISDHDSFRKQRLSTLRSHPSLVFPNIILASQNGHYEQFMELLTPVLEEIPRNANMTSRNRLVMGYFDDLLQTLINLKLLITKGGYVVYVVGNSLHGSHEDHFLIAADVIIAKLAEIAGYKVKSYINARMLNRRKLAGNHMRESVVFLQKE
jgi:hypothetical protein